MTIIGQNYGDRLVKGVYDLIDAMAQNCGFEVTSVVEWPGQSRNDGRILNLAGAEKTALEALMQLKPYDSFSVLARSFGCIVAGSVFAKVSAPERLILWGPPSYPILWRLFKRDINSTLRVAENKGTTLDPNVFESLIPFEELYDGLPKKTSFVTGARDMYTTPQFLDFLKASANPSKGFRFRIVNEAGHEVDCEAPVNVLAEYRAALFHDSK